MPKPHWKAAWQFWYHNEPSEGSCRVTLTLEDGFDPVEAQNTTVTVGSLGTQPTSQGPQFTASITAQGQLRILAEFEGILPESEVDGAKAYPSNVAQIEIGQESCARR